ncbi:MAG: hypothetical protein H7A50_17070 [Akkermansiaceae bacterium]|nr:hypothetical protein [Akkermansiaceae bacterium]
MLFASPWCAEAQTLHTEPQGMYTAKIAGPASTPGAARTYLGVQLPRTTVGAGLVGSASGSTFSLLEGTHPTEISDPAETYYVHVLDGAGRGRVIDVAAFSESSVTCAENIEAWLGSGTSIRIRPHPRIADLFGTDNRFALGAGTDADNADNLVFWDADTQHERVFYFHSTRDRWEEDGINSDAGNTPIRFPNGLYIVRRTPGTLRMSLSGEVGSEPLLVPARTGSNVFSLPVNLSGSLDAIVPAAGSHAVISGPNAASADLLSFEEPTTHTRRGPFYQLDRGGETGWREIGVDDSAAPLAPLDFLSTLVLQRSGPPGFLLLEGSLVPPAVPRPPLPPDPEPGEVELTGEFQLPPMPPGVSIAVEVSTDLQSWTYFADPVVHPDNRVTFTLPAGQTRAFYRLALSLSP